LYVSDVEASVPVPIRQLCGFRRIRLEPGETCTVTFVLTPRYMSLITDEGRQVVEPGAFRIAVGGRQPVPEDSGADGGEVVLGTLEVQDGTQAMEQC
jgi:beta-glucosidase